MKSNSLELQKLIVTRDGADLTAPIDLRLESGQMLVVRGANGSGKSTFIKMISGLLPVEKGALKLHYGDGAEYRPLYLGHRLGLTPGMTVRDNVAFWGHAAGYPELIAVAMHYFDLEDIANARLSTLSAGWKQRVALTRLITMPSPLWLLDEPSANLDVEGMTLLQSLLESRIAQGGMVVISTHGDIQGPAVKSIDLNNIKQQNK